ncbi:MAG: hypothetical protein ACRCV9_21030 [Burkholderiaceae bacterium]
MTITVGKKVQTGVYVSNEWRPFFKGVVVSQSFDGTLSTVDVGSLHGCAPRIETHQTSHLRLVETEPKK